MRIVLIGAVESTKVALETLAEACSLPVAVFSPSLDLAHLNSDFIDLSPICSRYSLPIHRFRKINTPQIVDEIYEYHPDVIFVIGLSQIIGRELLSVAPLGALGFHPSALPKNRGRAVIPWTIILQLKETGSTLFWLDEKVDSGPIASQRTFSVGPEETAKTLIEKHLKALKEMLFELIPKLQNGTCPAESQNEAEATWCAKRTQADGMIDWSWPARKIWDLIRAVSEPYPGAFTFYHGEKVIIWEAKYVGEAPYYGLPGQIQLLEPRGVLIQCGDGKHILLKTVQKEDSDKQEANELFTKLHSILGFNTLEAFLEIKNLKARSSLHE
jgi:methionyl-tRNA formyltransferase